MHPRSTIGLLALLAALVAASGLLVGQASLADPVLRPTLLGLRATRAAAAFLSGAALGAAGAVVQGIFRNPLVSPSILGTTAGASLGGQAILLAPVLFPGLGLLGGAHWDVALPLGCLAGAGLALGVLIAFCRERSSNLVLVLTGFVLAALFIAFGGLATSLAQDSWEVARVITAMALGGVGGTGGRQLAMALPLAAAALTAVWLWGPTLDVLLSGEEEAASLGVDVHRARRWTVAWVAMLTAAAVAVGGNLGFVGLVEPHVLRPLVGAHHRRLIPASALLGGLFVVACDILARALPTRSELPLGVVTGLIGAPVFLALLRRAEREAAHG